MVLLYVLKLACAGINHENIEGLDNVFSKLRDPFDGIDSCNKQEKYFKDSLGLIV